MKFNEEVSEFSILRYIRKIQQFFIDRPINESEIINLRYKVISLIGKGSYGLVYLCLDIKTNEIKVIKQLRPSKRRNKADIQLFNNEITVLRLLNHQNIPKLYDHFTENRNVFYVMHFIEGENLENQIFLKHESFNETRSLQFLTQLLDLVNYLHRNDIYHQDLRIPNIILKNKQPYLIDFGLSKQTLCSTSPKNQIRELKLQDYYGLGDILLYLLYTTYSSKNKKALPWTEELSLATETVHLLKRLLSIQKPYSNLNEISADLHAALKANDSHQ